MTPLARIIALPVRAYRLLLSPWVGHGCRFQPTCSAYALEALERHGAAGGSYLTLRRLARCSSALNASRRSKPCHVCAWACRACQAGVWSHRMGHQAFCIRASSLTASAQNARMPSASFSVAMASSFKARRNEASS